MVFKDYRYLRTYKMAGSSDPEMVTPAKKRISVVWDYFGVQKGNEDSIICQSCHRLVTAKNDNTSNLLAHLKTTHALLYKECREAMEQKAIASATKEPKKSKTYSTQPTLSLNASHTRRRESVMRN